jgi:hypothetical protein
MPPRELTDEDIADWLTPGQAVKILDTAFQKSYLSKQALLGRLAGGMAEAVSQQTVRNDGASGSWRSLLQKIPAEDWRKIQSTDTCWITGDLIFRRRLPSGTGDETVSHYAVRIEPQGVRAMIATGASAKDPAVKTPSPVLAEPKSPPVSEVHLQAWFEFYQKIGGEMREERALESARLNFPARSVTRKRIRDLLGPRPLGRPRTFSD